MLTILTRQTFQTSDKRATKNTFHLKWLSLLIVSAVVHRFQRPSSVLVMFRSVPNAFSSLFCRAERCASNLWAIATKIWEIVGCISVMWLTAGYCRLIKTSRRIVLSPLDSFLEQRKVSFNFNVFFVREFSPVESTQIYIFFWFTHFLHTYTNISFQYFGLLADIFCCCEV